MIRNDNKNTHNRMNNDAIDHTNNTQHTNTNTNDRNENHETNTIENRTTKNNEIEKERRTKENKKNDEASIVSIDDMNEEELQRYLEMATQLIPIEEESTEQPTENETNVQHDIEASEESSTIGGSHGKEPGMIRISGFNPNGIIQQHLEAQIQHCIDLSIDDSIQFCI